MTDSGGVAFEQSWPLAKASVERLLRAHQVPEADRDDIVQEVAARAFVRQEQFTSLTHLTRWSCRVAANLRVDQVRRGSRIADQPVPDWSDTTETARLVEGRMALEDVLSAVSRLSDADRVALFGEKEEAADRREAVRLAVRRHRARARLAAMVEGMIAAFAVLGRALSRRADTPGLREAVAMGSVALVAVAIPVVGAVRAAPEDTPVRQTTGDTMATYADVVRERPVPTTIAASGSHDGQVAPAPATTASRAESVRSVIGVRPSPVHGAEVGDVERKDPKTLCVRELTPGSEHCVDRPGPALPLPPLLPE